MQLESQKRQLEIEIRRAAVTGGYLNEMPDDVPVYKALGKWWVSTCDCILFLFVIVSI